ncbi:hypothetical protein Goklo_007355 [Gossypium klotzschianum]|uniref:Uncharacterized protein n=1 Tax=Gossypium klotzschianum TaxID=34286 RepID=A0A7J8W6H5_9ROSI|nr:hypothetical protein [Gossypium klotzschianum]
MDLLRCSRIQVDRIYSKEVNVPTFLRKDLILAHPDARKKVDVFALNIYGLAVIFKTLGHVDKAVTDLFDLLEKRVTPVPVDKVLYRVFFESYSPLKEIVATPRKDDVSKEKWMTIF